MTSEKRASRPAIKYGPTALTVARNLKRVREARGLTTYALSGALRKAERPITPSAVAKIERGERQVTVDDLAALAFVLDVSPASLLLPLEDGLEAHVSITGAGEVPADVAWAWASSERPIRLPEGDARTAMLEYQLYALPPGRRRYDWTAPEAREAWRAEQAKRGPVVLRLPAPPPVGERSIQQLARVRRNYEGLALVTPTEEVPDARGVLVEHDPEAFEPRVTEWMEERGLLPILRRGESDGAGLD
ncbi:helix-turn-helix domain-containing protein [Streptomyces sp. DSM 44915]|uniref:Helix-turn-helix domain-containing protein n=1 Tax=Streptomyces chisholmiae TaxID=3075540 RepID=A0ABU2K193_9ACTN|nr:helix-turn-helix domain-containing protein [Streptomyces sp. DSM 44915]MDT0270847.1 helix-turn-helix domain-containing protein [Streptomyces sp. DSM 44915]